MDKQEFFDRISFPTEYRNEKELKTSIILLFLTCLIFFILSSLMIIFNLFLLSKVLLLGTIAYEFILFFLLDSYTKGYIKKQIKGNNIKRTLSVTSTGVFGLLIIMTFITLIYSMITPNPTTENKFISLTISLLLIMMPTFFWHELVMGFKKKYLKKLKFLGLGIMILSLPLMGVASAENETNSLMGGLNTVQQGLDFINQLKNGFSSVQEFFQNNLNLTEQQTQIVIIIAVLILAFLLLKFLSVIVKWVIVILIAWIIIQMFLL
ncbi:MAG: hypothetical protein WC307_05840 [Candidatus Nanoarchaeia archaeon]|jgi:hypothetical protein